MRNQYKLVNTTTVETLTTGNDNTLIFGGPWGDLQQGGVAVWQDNTLTKAEKYAAVNDKYAAEIASIREAIRFMTDTGKSAATLQTKLADKYAEWKSALQAVVGGA